MQVLTLSSILQISLVLSLLAAIPSITKAQTKANYFTDYYPLTNQAELSYIDGNYEAALKHYQTAFENAEALRWDLVEAAKTALKLADKAAAVAYLLKAFEKGTTLKFIKKQEDFADFNASNWKTLKKNYPQKHKAFAAKLNEEWRKEIKQMLKIDQKYRKNTAKYNKNFEVQNRLDSLQAVRIIEMMDERGFLSEAIVGIEKKQEQYKNGNPAFFDILLHCHSAYRKDYFIPLLIESAKKGLCSPRLAALLVDQTALYSGEPQKYGTYRCKNEGVRMPCRLADEEKVNEWRASVGLESFEDHLKKMDLEYTWKPLEDKSEKPKK
ncbi:MAG: hypothetical protein ACPGVB_09455 [Chitinophagales bacterium]